MSRGIPISKKHGVNPTMLICPICLHETNGLALLGKLPGDAEAPRYSLDREPCADCRKVIDGGGVMLIEIKDRSTEQNPERTGYVVGVKAGVIDENAVDARRVGLIRESDMKAVMGDLYKQEIREGDDE